MKNKFLNIIYQDEVGENFHDTSLVNFSIDKDKFQLRICADNSYTDCTIFPLGKENLPFSIDSKELYIIDLVIEKPIIHYNNFISAIDFQNAEIAKIKQILNKKNKCKFEIALFSNLPYPDYEPDIFTLLTVEGNSFFWNVVGHVFDYKKSEDEDLFVIKNYTDLTRRGK